MVFFHQSLDPVDLLLRGDKIVLLKALCHIVNKCAFVGAHTGAIQRDTIKICFELLNVLAQLRLNR